MPDGSVPLLVSLFVLILFSAFFSATETAYTCVSRIKLKSLAANKNKRAAKVLRLAEEHYDKLLSTILIGNNIVNLSASTVCALLCAKLLADFRLNASVISTAIITVIVLVFGEITPKFVAKSCAEKLSLAVYPVISTLIILFIPLTFLFSGWKKLIAKIFRLNSEETITEEEIITMVEEAEEDGTLKKEETKLICSAIEFDDLEAADILVPRVAISAVEKNAGIDGIKKVFEDSGFSRLPVYENGIDSISGIIHEKDFYRIFSKGENSIESIIQKPFFVTEHIKISKLLRQMQKEKTHMAVVLDEYGGTLGIVTMEDILEELVGEIYDEHDSQIDYIQNAGKNTFIIHGDTPLGKLFKFFNLEEEPCESNTVSGWIIEKLGDFPAENQKLSYENLEIEVLRINGKTIQDVRVKKLDAPENTGI
ncbi:MAG: HlyC/CorC family transporter [Treponema sp.]|nr:HlyC/CorC family transporter [Treponema sp.]